ncbi:hypothetical protein [Neoaquamicrobium sediminum]|uniref:Uncharacterized protein n=1 Tax=Neoaquamicrobium sediminum TaxID=1849104 RepID=A0ABV3X1C4_9HYPH
MFEFDVQGKGAKQSPASSVSTSPCGRNCATCPEKVTCPLSPYAISEDEGGRA